MRRASRHQACMHAHLDYYYYLKLQNIALVYIYMMAGAVINETETRVLPVPLDRQCSKALLDE